jgi:microsomal epoxide hydrolase
MSKTQKTFGTLPPNARITTEDFVVAFPQTELDDLRSLIAASRVGPDTFEGFQQDRKYGISAQWLRDAKTSWLEDFNWYVLLSFFRTGANS